MNIRRDRWYNCINIIVMILTALIFIGSYKEFSGIFRSISPVALIILIATVIFVHLIKACRLYFAIYGVEISRAQYLKTYCKVTPVSVIIPFKLGEFFRMYCYGKQLGNVLKGIIIILFDRFMDTIALVTVILLTRIFNGGHMAPFMYLLFIFLIFILMVYSIFPGVYSFWKMYLLRTKATEHTLVVLKIFELLNVVYLEMAGVAKGRGIILYFLSLTAWGGELISISLLNGVLKGERLYQTISSYLAAAIYGSQSIHLERFVFVSVMLLAAGYVVLKVIEMVNRKKADEECK